MGKTPNPLAIGIYSDDAGLDAVTELKKQGHLIVLLPPVDVILTSMTLTKKSYIDAALRGARKRKKDEAA